MFDIKEFIFDGVTNSPDVPYQGMDMHSFYDGEFIWYPYADYTDGAGLITNNIIRFNPITEALDIYPLEDVLPVETFAYQVIQGTNPADNGDTIWVYSAYSNRGVWKVSKSDLEPVEPPPWIPFSGSSGTAGGKIISIMIDDIEHLVSTSVTGGGYPVAYNTDSGVETDLSTWLPLGTYGVQTDGENIFMVSNNTKLLYAFTLNATGTAPVGIVTTPTIGAVDIAWDRIDRIWTASRILNKTAMVEQFEPVYTGDIVTSFNTLSVKWTGAPYGPLPASVRANADYVAVVWEGSFQGTLGWTILDRKTGIWTNYYNKVTSTTVPESIFPFSGQYWTTVTVEIEAPNAIFCTGYSPAQQGGYMQESACPNFSMRMIKFTPVGGRLSGASIAGSILK